MAEVGYTLIDLTIILVKIIVVIAAILLTVVVLTLSERRIAGFIQDRLGPNRVGPQGIFQPIADGVKFFFKEDVIPSKVEKVIYILSPALVLAPALLTFAVIPFGETWSVMINGVKYKYDVPNMDDIAEDDRTLAYIAGQLGQAINSDTYDGNDLYDVTVNGQTISITALNTGPYDTLTTEAKRGEGTVKGIFDILMCIIPRLLRICLRN